MEKVYYVYCPKTGYTKYQHANRISARKEAERLAKLYPGDVFQVLALDSQCTMPPPVTPTWVEVEEDDIPF